MDRDEFYRNRDLGDETHIIDVASDVIDRVMLVAQGDGSVWLEIPDEVLTELGLEEGDDVELEYTEDLDTEQKMLLVRKA